jgi:hypothetical protein
MREVRKLLARIEFESVVPTVLRGRDLIGAIDQHRTHTPVKQADGRLRHRPNPLLR